MQITPDQALAIVHRADGNQDAHIASFSEIQSTSYSYTTSWTSYHIALVDSDKSYFLLVSPPPPTEAHPDTIPITITLPSLSVLLCKILDSTAVPVPRPVAHDVDPTTHATWLLLRVPGDPAQARNPPTTLASVRERLSPVQRARVELRLGTHIAALHGLTHDRFGLPVDELVPAPSLVAPFSASHGGEGEWEDMTAYSWQDTFVVRLEHLLDGVCGDTAVVEVDVDQLRRSLARAIGSFLFDDVEVPRLVWVTGNDEDVVVSVTEGEDGMAADVAYMLPTFGHALWGDPLMEAWFMPPGPTVGLKEGYFGGEEDGTLIVFPRQHTKRVWYTVYLTLLVLKSGEETGRERIEWAKRVLVECVETLKKAPCY